jgi:hypothetical protein
MEALQSIQHFILALIPWVLWTLFWLLAVDWKKLWPVLGQGAWAPAVLLILVSALVWSRIEPGPCNCLGFVTVPELWWHLGGVCTLAALAFLAGWLQGYFAWEPQEVVIDPPTSDEHHGHDAHGHDHH